MVENLWRVSCMFAYTHSQYSARTSTTHSSGRPASTNLLSSLSLMTNSASLIGEQAIKGFTVNQDNLEEALYRNPVLVTALNPVIGYAKAAEIAKTAYKENKPVIDVAEAMTDIPRDELVQLLDPEKLTRP